MTKSLNELNICDMQNDTRMVQDYTMVVTNPIHKKPPMDAVITFNKFKKIFMHVYISLKTNAFAGYKSSVYLETNDIENLKRILNSTVDHDDRIEKFKENLTADLTKFQQEIEQKHLDRVKQLVTEKKTCEVKMKELKAEKQRLMSNFVTKLKCIFSTESKDLEIAIDSTQARIDSYKMQLKKLKKCTPTANEKDVILYQMHLKEKYAKLF